MATIVTEALLSASVELLLDKFVSGEFVDFFRRKKLDDSLLEKLKSTLLSLKPVLNDAEEKQITNPDVKEWLDHLRDAVFDAADLLDEINTEALRCKVEAESQTIGDQVWNVLCSPFNKFYKVINSNMQNLFERLEQFAKNGHRLGLKGVSSNVRYITPTSSVVDESAIYGRDGDKKKLTHYLLSDNASDSGRRIGVISIVGMGGLGKTTLAKLLYNDPEINRNFNLTAWAHIPKDFDVLMVTKTILESATSKRIETDNLNTLQLQLQQILRHRKFLLVLDDIWEVNYVGWNNLNDIFSVGDMGSKIIITTRDERVALAMQTFLPIHYLTPLGSDDCWSLLAKHAFGAINSHQQSNLEEIGMKIAIKCNGLPLAAIALRGLLRTKSSRDEWNMVLNSNIWDLPNDKVLPALQLSYHYLPGPLKQCFIYCAIYPKNFTLKKNTVVQLWIAEGLVHQPKSQKSWEGVGEDYFDELVSRSLIHRRYIDEEESFEMHDLINDLATSVSSAYCIRLEEQVPNEIGERVRYLSYNRRKGGSLVKFDKMYGLKCLHTFLALPQSFLILHKPYYLLSEAILDLLPAMKQLRVLSLANYVNITGLLNSLGNWKHLRYLDLSFTRIRNLPSMTCRLYNLQTLLLCECQQLIELPEDMGKLVNLRHLDIRGTRLQEMPAQIARLQNLHTLSDFIVSEKHHGLKIAELGKFIHLQGKLSISTLQNVTNPSDASQANLLAKKGIEELKLGWLGGSNSQASQIVLEQLQPSTNLKKLTIVGYDGTSFPNWLGDSSFVNMVYLSIWCCDGCSWMPPLGQLHSLKKLYICMKSVKKVGAEFYGTGSPSFQPFPSLETLEFHWMLKWEEWDLIGATSTEFPRLRRLSLQNCPKLKGNTPTNLPSLTELWLRNCPLLESRHSDDNITRPSSCLFMLPFTSLQKLTLKGFPSMMSFPRYGLPKTLEFLKIVSCKNLEFLPQQSLHNYTSLKALEIKNSCDSMTSFTLGSFPVLASLMLTGCENLKSVLIAKDAAQSLSFLTILLIQKCHELESFAPGGLPAPRLIYLLVYVCDKLKSLPPRLNTLVGLRYMRISKLPSLQSLDSEGFPINLLTLSIGKLGGILLNTSITEWCLERLTCLSEFIIEGEDVLNALMKMEASFLPTSLVSLIIGGIHNIKCLNVKWLQHHTSLQTLLILKCSNLKMLTMPEEGLPSLTVLHIRECPLLEERYRRKRGKELAKIPHNATVFINDQLFDQDHFSKGLLSCFAINKSR